MKRFSYVSLLAAALIAAGLMTVPTAQAQGICVDSVTAGGWVETGTDLFANFGLNAEDNLTTGVLTGQLDFVNADETCHVVGFEVLSYTILDDFCREIVYAVTVNGVEGFTADVIVCDYGEGVNATPDTFSIAVTNTATGEIVGECGASGNLIGGNVQLHSAHGNCP